jgi:hypothetical protein
MVRRALSVGGALRYGASRMNGEKEKADSKAGPADDAPQPRPWTPEAAMEPVPPLAPPPARPGAGMPVLTTPRFPDPAAPFRRLLIALGVALVLAGVVVLVLAVAH